MCNFQQVILGIFQKLDMSEKPSPFATMATELVDQIVGRLGRQELKNVRLTCKLLSTIATSHLFDTITISPFRSVLASVDRTVSRFGEFIKILRFIPQPIDYKVSCDHMPSGYSTYSCFRQSQLSSTNCAISARTRTFSGSGVTNA